MTSPASHWGCLSRGLMSLQVGRVWMFPEGLPGPTCSLGLA